MEDDVRRLSDELDVLALDLQAWFQAVLTLRERNVPPSDEIAKRALALRGFFDTLRSSTADLAIAAELASATPVLDLDNPDALKECLLEVAAARKREAERRRSARNVLGRVLKIAHLDHPDWGPLGSIRSDALALQKAFGQGNTPELRSMVGAVLDGTHPLAVLVRFISDGTLEDKEWDTLRIRIKDLFGDAVAVGAARGRLSIVPPSRSAPVAQAEPASAEPASDSSGSDQALEPSQDASTRFPKAERLAGNDSGAETSAGVVPTPAELVMPTPSAPSRRAGGTPDSSGSDQLIEPSRNESTPLPPAKERADIHRGSGTSATLVPTSPPLVIPKPATPSPVDESHPERITANPPETALAESAGAAKLAALALEASAAVRTQLLQELQWQFILEGFAGLAFHLAEEIEESNGENHDYFPAWTILSAIIGPHIREQDGDIATQLSVDLANFGNELFERRDKRHREPLRLLLAAAALRPSVVAPATGAPSILLELYSIEGLARFQRLCRSVGETASKLDGPLDPITLRAVRSRAAWQGELQRLQQELDAWRTRARTMTMIYAPATQVWKKWLDSGPIARIVACVLDDSPGAIQEVQHLYSELHNESYFKRLVRDTQRQIHGNAVVEIQPQALLQLGATMAEARGFAGRWLQLQAQRSQESARRMEEQAAKLRKDINALSGDAESELDKFAGGNSSRALRAGAMLCKQAVRSLVDLFDTDAEVNRRETPVRYLLHADLLRIPDIPMGQDWRPQGGTLGQLLDRLLEAASNGVPNCSTAFEQRSKARDHEATERIIEYLRFAGEPKEIARLRSVRESAVRDSQEALHADLAATRTEIERAATSGLLQEDQRSRNLTAIDTIEQESHNGRFFEAHETLRNIRDQMEGRRNAQLEAAQTRLHEMAAQLEPASHDWIAAAIAKGDIRAATEYLEIAAAGHPLSISEESEDPFARFFPDSFRQLLEHVETRRNIKEIIKEVRDRRLPGVPMTRVSGGQTSSPAGMAEAWFEIKRVQRIGRADMNAILEGLGFNPVRVNLGAVSRGGAWVTFRQEPGIEDRESCPVAAYGSAARGNYRLLCLWQKSGETELLNVVGDSVEGVPRIILYFGRLTEKERRELAHHCRLRSRTVVVIDDLFMLSLCGTNRSARLKALFSCALPFTFLEPYVTSATLVPPEMFYGRERERASIIDPKGSCFVYGGRQLGKTALLLNVEHSFGRDDRKVAIWLDLKAFGIGYDRLANDIWPLLASKLKERKVLPAATPQNVGPDLLAERVEEWLAQDEERRVLLLLDDADRFLEQDGRPERSEGEFTRVAKLKGLMDRTQGRFKVVFAGLHNVRRSMHLENNPLAHYGEPICLGTLLDNGEWRQARRLIEQPLAVIGYRFESEDLVTSILAQTNYYPSLIQLYCSQLVRHLHTVPFDQSQTPPYLITARHVDEVSHSQALRKAIRDRFTATLDLDPRYRVIALCIASHRDDASAQSEEDGLPVDWIYKAAVNCWTEGFKHLSQDAFRDLLEEMVDLGILRRGAIGHYILRSLNVALLMGTDEEIFEELLSNSNKEPPREYEPATLRSSYRKDLRDGRRNPLSARQESELRAPRSGVAIVCGCNAAGLQDVGDFLKLAVGDEYFFETDGPADFNGFDHKLGELCDRRKEGTSLLFVPPNLPWNRRWVESAIVRTSRMQSQESFARVIFIADPAALWQLLADGYDVGRDAIEQGIGMYTLGPWTDGALRHWLDDCRLSGISREDRREIARVTGNWSFLLYRFRELVGTDEDERLPALRVIESEMGVPQKARELLDLFGVAQMAARRVLEALRQSDRALDDPELASASSVSEAESWLVLTWARTLGLVRSAAGDRGQVDEVLGRLLKAASATES